MQKYIFILELKFDLNIVSEKEVQNSKFKIELTKNAGLKINLHF